MKALLLTVSAVLLAASIYNVVDTDVIGNDIPSHIHTLYSKWTVKYGVLRATPAERAYRLSVFYKSFLINQELRVQMPSAEFGLNYFADISLKEFASNYLGALPVKDVEEEEESLTMSITSSSDAPRITAPPSYMVPGQRGVGFQGECGSCWAWSVKHLVQDALQGSVEISPQHIMNCDDQNANCRGGYIEKGMATIENYGYRLETEDPYLARASNCKGASSRKLSKTGKYIWGVRSEDEVKRTMAGYQTGVAIRIQAENNSWKNFKGGVFSNRDPTCSAGNTNHAVTLVGYNSDRGFWRLRNSWGNWWGEAGYAWLQINAGMSNPSGCYCGSKAGAADCVMGYWR